RDHDQVPAIPSMDRERPQSVVLADVEDTAKLRLIAKDADGLFQVRDLNRHEDGACIRDQDHLTAVAAKALGGVEEDLETAAVQVCDPGEIEDQCPRYRFNELVHDGLESRGGCHVHLSCCTHHRNPFDLPDGYHETLFFHENSLSAVGYQRTPRVS